MTVLQYTVVTDLFCRPLLVANKVAATVKYFANVFNHCQSTPYETTVQQLKRIYIIKYIK